jgi:hypothetical protein
MKVFKKGITTGETIGLFTSITVHNTIDIEQFDNSAYSRGGDSGALVCVEHDDKLASFGIRFSGSQGFWFGDSPEDNIRAFLHEKPSKILESPVFFS